MLTSPRLRLRTSQIGRFRASCFDASRDDGNDKQIVLALESLNDPTAMQLVVIVGGWELDSLFRACRSLKSKLGRSDFPLHAPSHVAQFVDVSVHTNGPADMLLRVQFSAQCPLGGFLDAAPNGDAVWEYHAIDAADMRDLLTCIEAIGEAGSEDLGGLDYCNESAKGWLLPSWFLRNREAGERIEEALFVRRDLFICRISDARAALLLFMALESCLPEQLRAPHLDDDPLYPQTHVH